ncbi:MAG: DUF1549 domain-containing protein [Pirellulales bacterium]
MADFVVAAEKRQTAVDVSPEHAKLFEEQVRPILARHCFQCHSHAAGKDNGGLMLDSRGAMLTGGDSGAALVPGKPAESLLITAVKYEEDYPRMPPKGKIPESDVAALVKWVELGAPWPGADDAVAARPKEKITDEDRKYWAFQPVRDFTPPQVAAAAWQANPIDRFIRARLDQEGLPPSPQAEKAAWIRRVYFDLIGLPPSAEEIEDFVRDDSADAFEKLVDRLLASPRYGERWARHWLDLVRYAESDGYRIDDYRPDAWRYRDYVIRSFNADKPYDQFVCEQLAGDELAPDDPEAQLATNFLTLGIYEYNNRDVRGQWTNMLNDVTDVTADVFMGLGLGWRDATIISLIRFCNAITSRCNRSWRRSSRRTICRLPRGLKLPSTRASLRRGRRRPRRFSTRSRRSKARRAYGLKREPSRSFPKIFKALWPGRLKSGRLWKSRSVRWRTGK